MKDQALQQLSHSCNAVCSTFANSILKVGSFALVDLGGSMPIFRNSKFKVQN